MISSKQGMMSKKSVSMRRRISTNNNKFESPDREKFRYNMIYNKMHHLLNDEGERKKRQIMGSRNLNTQAKIMITQPSQLSFSLEGQFSHVALSPGQKVSLPPVLSPKYTHESFFTASRAGEAPFEV